jgi:hypothetical protein
MRAENQAARKAAAAHQRRISPAAATNRGERSAAVTVRSLDERRRRNAVA